VRYGKNWGIADLAINYSSGTASFDLYTQASFPGAVSRFELGINLQDYYLNGTPGQGGQGVAYLANVFTWESSFANSDPVPNVSYGGAYKSSSAPAGSQISPVEVRMLEYENYAQGQMVWVVNDPAVDPFNAIPDYKITVTFLNIPGDQAEFLWGTALCGNDIVTPIPGTLLLLGSSLLGLVGVGLRKKVKS
jgi:hypothetical protein